MLTTTIIAVALAVSGVSARSYVKCATFTGYTNAGPVRLELGSYCDWTGCDQDIWYIGPQNFNGVRWSTVQVSPGSVLKFNTNKVINTYWKRYDVWDGRVRDDGTWYTGADRLNMVSCQMRYGGTELRTCASIHQHHNQKGKATQLKIECSSASKYGWDGCSEWSYTSNYWKWNASSIQVMDGCTVWLYYGVAWGYLTWNPGNRRINSGQKWNFDSKFNDNLYKWWCRCTPGRKRRLEKDVRLSDPEGAKLANTLDLPSSNGVGSDAEADAKKEAEADAFEPPMEVQSPEAIRTELLHAIHQPADDSDEELEVEGREYWLGEPSQGDGKLFLNGQQVESLPGTLQNVADPEAEEEETAAADTQGSDGEAVSQRLAAAEKATVFDTADGGDDDAGQP